MDKDKIAVTPHDEQRIRFCTLVLAGDLTMTQAATALGLSTRQMRRVVAAFTADGVRGIVHGNRGRSPAHRLADDTKAVITDLLRGPYAAMNDCHVVTLLAERHALVVSRSTVRRVRAAANLTPARTRRTSPHRARRERMPKAGLLVQIDGSHHRWFGPDYPPRRAPGRHR